MTSETVCAAQSPLDHGMHPGLFTRSFEGGGSTPDRHARLWGLPEVKTGKLAKTKMWLANTVTSSTFAKRSRAPAVERGETITQETAKTKGIAVCPTRP